MSNIIRAKNNLKQKLSLNDYITPSTKNTNKHTRKLVTKKLNTSHKTTNNPTRIPVSQFASTEEKIKATYYLSKEDNQALIDVFIKRLQEQHKTDKSALISEAIRLLYKKEMK